jgi:hypothetical protein
MEYSLDAHFDGQKRINGELCRVDWKLIRALNVLYEILETMRPHVKEQMLEALKQAIDDADLTSGKVASIKPPGCDPEEREDPGPTYTPPPANTTQQSV